MLHFTPLPIFILRESLDSYCRPNYRDNSLSPPPIFFYLFQFALTLSSYK